MGNASAEPLVSDFFAVADIEINGGRPCDIQSHNPQFFKRLGDQLQSVKVIWTGGKRTRP